MKSQQEIFQSLSPDTYPSPNQVARAGHLERTVMLKPDADWQQAVEKNLARQNLYNNVVKEVFNSFTRIVGWSLISLVSLAQAQVSLK